MSCPGHRGDNKGSAGMEVLAVTDSVMAIRSSGRDAAAGTQHLTHGKRSGAGDAFRLLSPLATSSEWDD